MAEDNRFMEERVEVLTRELHVWRLRLGSSVVRCRSGIAAAQSMLAAEAGRCRLEIATACDSTEFEVVTVMKRLAAQVSELKGLSLGGIEKQRLWGEQQQADKGGEHHLERTLEHRPHPAPRVSRGSLIEPTGIPPLPQSSPTVVSHNNGGTFSGSTSGSATSQADTMTHRSGSARQQARGHHTAQGHLQQPRGQSGGVRDQDVSHSIRVRLDHRQSDAESPPQPQRPQLQRSYDLQHRQDGRSNTRHRDGSARRHLVYAAEGQHNSVHTQHHAQPYNHHGGHDSYQQTPSPEGGVRHSRRMTTDSPARGSPQRTELSSRRDSASSGASFSFSRPPSDSMHNSPATTRKSSFAGFSAPSGDADRAKSPDCWIMQR